MEIVKLELDFLVGPIVKEVFNESKNKLITGIDLIDNDNRINELNDEISALYSSFYDFDSGESCKFNVELAKENKSKLVKLIDDLIVMLKSVNDGSFMVVNNINLDF